MNRKIAFLFPGQGAQYPGMGRDFYTQFLVAREVFEEADECLGAHFSKLIFEGPAPELTQTKNSQLAIYIVSIALWRCLQKECPELQPAVCAGLSLGEYSALTASGKLPFREGLLLVRARATFMQEACERQVGSMQVVLGLEEAQVQEAIAGLNGVWIANLNCPGQIVIAGTLQGLEKAALPLKEKGARRVLPLEVSGAFHSGLMESAKENLKPLIQSVSLHPGNAQIVMNAVGDYVENTEEIRTHLINQVTHPVRWQKGIEAMRQSGIVSYYEIGPGKTLAGMNKRIGIEEGATVSLEKLTDLEGVLHATR